jgi:hypothetical protein
MSAQSSANEIRKSRISKPDPEHSRTAHLMAPWLIPIATRERQNSSRSRVAQAAMSDIDLSDRVAR